MALAAARTAATHAMMLRGLAGAAAASSGAGVFGTLRATTRESSGSDAAASARKEGLVPAVYFEPGSESKTLLALPAREVAKVVDHLTPAGFVSRVFELQVEGRDAPLRVLPKQVHVNQVTEAIENVTFLRCQPDDTVKVEVPLVFVGAEDSPGIRRGGFLNRIRRTVPCKCKGDAVPHYFQVDVSHLDAGETVSLVNVSVPDGVQVGIRDHNQPIAKIGGKIRRT